MVVGGEYIHKLDDVMIRVDGHRGRIPEAVFVFLPEKYPMTVYSKDNRHTLSPTMVKTVSLLIE